MTFVRVTAALTATAFILASRWDRIILARAESEAAACRWWRQMAACRLHVVSLPVCPACRAN